MKYRNNICFICFRRFPDTNFGNYSKYAEKSGFDVTVISYLEEGQEAFEIDGKRKIYRIALPPESNDRKRMLYFMLKASQILRKKRFSIVHIHSTCAYFLMIKLFSPGCGKFIFHSTSYPISESRQGSLRKMLLWFIQGLFMDKVLIQSLELKNKLIGLRRLKKTLVVPIGFDKDIFFRCPNKEKISVRRALNIEIDKLLLVYCGSISFKRELHRILLALQILDNSRFPFQMVFIGEGDALDFLKSESNHLSLTSRVNFLGRIPYEKMGRYLAAADIGLSFIPINENYNYNPPLKTFEYLACGLATVATNTISNQKIIQNGVNGMLVEDTPEDLAKCIVRLKEDKSLYEQIRQNGPKSVEQFDFEKITKETLIPIYNALIAKSASHSQLIP